MRHTGVRRAARAIVVGVMVFGLFMGCAGRRISTSVQDQTFVPGPSPRVDAPVVEEAKGVPVVPVPPAPVAAPKPPPTEPSVSPEAPIVAMPSTPARVEEASVAEEPIAPAPAPQPVSLADVYFDFDQFSVRTDAQTALAVNARTLNADHTVKIVIEGHCDERGTLAYNLVLGERRAKAAKRYLQELGVPASRIETVSYGKERPFCTDHSEACWQSNRRAHFRRP